MYDEKKTVEKNLNIFVVYYSLYFKYAFINFDEIYYERK